jgi:FMN phosphatase YigB (HAD superfamily)
MEAHLDLKAFPDAPSALKSLKDVGIKLAFLSNLTPHMLKSVTKSSGLEGIFEHSLSTDAVKIYKPDPRAYQMGIDAFMLRREEILFAAFGGWDAAGAKMFGYTTFWVNRLTESPSLRNWTLSRTAWAGRLPISWSSSQTSDRSRVRRAYRPTCCRIFRERLPAEYPLRAPR